MHCTARPRLDLAQLCAAPSERNQRTLLTARFLLCYVQASS